MISQLILLFPPAISGSGGSQGKESFDKHIALILQRTTTNPLMKASANMSSEESYEILARCTKGRILEICIFVYNMS